MKDFFSILRRFVPPYKYYLALNIFFNILASVLTLFSFALIIPILEILFKLKQASYTFMEWGSGSIKDVVINNFYYYVSQMIQDNGPTTALIFLGLFLADLFQDGRYLFELLFHDTASVGNRARYSQLCV